MIYRREMQEGCGCQAPRGRTVERRTPARRNPMLAERGGHHLPPRLSRHIEPIKFGNCRPYFRIETDPEGFAACNKLADEIGPINTPKKAVRILEEVIGNEPYEVFGVMPLDLHLRYKPFVITGRGEAAAVMAPMVPTLQAALVNGAYAVIISHLHPSGIEAKPSEADNETTKAFVEAFEKVGVIFVDHVILGGDAKRRSYYSYAEHRKI